MNFIFIFYTVLFSIISKSFFIFGTGKCSLKASSHTVTRSSQQKAAPSALTKLPPAGTLHQMRGSTHMQVQTTQKAKIHKYLCKNAAFSDADHMPITLLHNPSTHHRRAVKLTKFSSPLLSSC